MNTGSKKRKPHFGDAVFMVMVTIVYGLIVITTDLEKPGAGISFVAASVSYAVLWVMGVHALINPK